LPEFVIVEYTEYRRRFSTIFPKKRFRCDQSAMNRNNETTLIAKGPETGGLVTESQEETPVPGLHQRCWSAACKQAGGMLFQMAYNLYVHTPLGPYLHHQSIKSLRTKDCPPHSIVNHAEPHRLTKCDVYTIPLLSDNYAFILVDHATQQAALVDPCDAEEVASAARRLGVRVTHVLTTHHHHDHSGGNLQLKKTFPDVKVYGGTGEHVPGATHEVEHADWVSVGATRVQVFKTPFHTLNHVVFAVVSNAEPSPDDTVFGNRNIEAVFTGDVVLPGACGRLFRGTPQTAYDVLNVGLFAQLPEKTWLFSGHEYSLVNLKFAAWLIPEDTPVNERLSWVKARRGEFLPTIPVTMGYERRSNVFMRIHDTRVRSATMCRSSIKPETRVHMSDAEIFRALRALKDDFKPSKEIESPGN